jgi:hypothetical protein
MPPYGLDLAAGSAVGEWEQRDVARALDCNRHRALVPGTGAELASWLDLPALADVATQPRDIFVVHVINVIGAELADFAPAGEPSAATAATASTATWSTALRAIASALTLGLRATEAG